MVAGHAEFHQVSRLREQDHALGSGQQIHHQAAHLFLEFHNNLRGVFDLWGWLILFHPSVWFYRTTLAVILLVRLLEVLAGNITAYTCLGPVTIVQHFQGMASPEHSDSPGHYLHAHPTCC